MPRPRAELRGRLRYRVCGPGPRLSLLHVRLSAAAARALRGCGRRQVGPGRAGPGEPGADGTHRRPLLLQGAPGPVIAFQGSQGCLTVPGSPGTAPRFFAFSLSRCSRDEPQGSFECARLAVPRLGQSWLDSLGSIQEKITVCAQESTCPLLRERVSPAKEPCSRAVVEPDPAVLGYGKGVTALEKVAVTSPLGKGSACHIHVPTTASPRASVQSLIQRRALRPHRKHELLQWLEGMPAGRPGGARLLAVLEEVRVPAAAPARLRECCSMPTLLCSPEVTKLDPTACCYRMKGTLAGRAQEGWPGNTAQEQQQAALPQHSHAGELENPESEEEAGDDWEESARHPEQHLSAPRDARSQARSSSLAEIPDYLRRKYRTIGSAEQCRAYEAAFSADYTEYRYLHARIGNVSQKFIQLGAKMKTLKQGTEERKTYPSYQQEKNRCEYLHQKLSHIKSLILQFEGGGSC
ncbi:RNA polymerase II elongation factor ELL3 [Aptenodytes patagonicus]|uniref:RNA polymerase II elongation factor ELL3 n=1 Tax=Aptenodytes patagonicus TaxID=9234 RepID=UPI003F9FAC12